ncbi:MAG: hypothetical protein J5662_09245, partial [Clostridia bacterium]|nr:hypothetical protein [Clostridia bacterium]
LHGVNLHHSGKTAYQSVYSAIMEAKALGSNIIRFNYDPGEDGYSDDDLSYVLSVAEIVEQNGMELVLVLDGFNQVFSASHPDYTNSVVAANYTTLATALAGKVAYYQIGNEIDNIYEQYSTYGFASKDAVAQKAASALIAAKNAITTVDSSAQIILNFGWTHFEFLNKVSTLGYTWDVTGLDWYSDTTQSVSATYYQTVISQAVSYYSKPVMVCETGLWPYDNNGTLAYVSDVNWLVTFANYCQNNANVIGFIMYELYDEGDAYVNNSFEKENCFGLFDINKNEKAITPYIRALFGGTANSRDFSPAVPVNSYADTDVAIDAEGVASVQGKVFSWLGDNITHKGFEAVDISNYLNIEFDLYVEDYDDFMTVYTNAGFNTTAGHSSFRFRLLNTLNISSNYAYDEFDISQITHSGWNHISMKFSGLSQNNFDVTSVTGYDLYIENYGGKSNRNYLNASSGMVFAISNLYATNYTNPAVNNVMGETVGELNVGNGLVTSGWRFGRYYDAGCYQEGLTAVDLSGSDYIELDMFVEDRQGILDAIADLDSKNGDAGSRWRFILSSIPGDYRGSNYSNVYYVEFFENYIKNDGWNHIVIPISAFEHTGSATLSSIASWGIDFYIATGDTNIAKDQTLCVYNICGTRIVPPEVNNVMGETVGALNVGNGLKTSGWRYGKYWDSGCFQEDLTPVDLSGSDYIELDMFVENRQGILDAIADLDSKNGDNGARWRFLLSSLPGDHGGNNYASVYYVESFENYIKNDGWNHIVIPVNQLKHTGSATLSSIASWGIKFYVGTGDTNIAKDQTLCVYNICGTRIVPPEVNNVMGETVGALNVGNGLKT